MLFPFLIYIYYFKSLLEHLYPELDDADILSTTLNVGADIKDKTIPGEGAQYFSFTEFNFMSLFVKL